MDYYVSKKAGSILLRKPNKMHLVAGDCIPPAAWKAIPADSRKEMLSAGTVEAFSDPDSVELADAPAPEQDIKIGTGKNDFMPEAKVQKGERRDAALQELIAKQEESEVDEDAGGSADGVVAVERADDEDYDDDGDEEDALTSEEQAAIRKLEEEN